MKVLVVSDTHGSLTNFEKMLRKEGKRDMVLHCGDAGGEEDRIARLAGCETYFARGNCDVYSSSPWENTVQIGDYRALIVHGHKYHVDYSLDMLVYTAKERLMDMVFYGHTHVPYLENEAGIWVGNPGSLSRPRTYDQKYTYIVIEINEDGGLKLELRNV